jgi:hypothetical protein
MLDAELNARLGDFGLSRLHDHGADPYTTHVAIPSLLRLLLNPFSLVVVDFKMHM